MLQKFYVQAFSVVVIPAATLPSCNKSPSKQFVETAQPTNLLSYQLVHLSIYFVDNGTVTMLAHLLRWHSANKRVHMHTTRALAHVLQVPQLPVSQELYCCPHDLHPANHQPGQQPDPQ